MIAVLYVPTVHGSAVMTYTHTFNIEFILKHQWCEPTIQTRIIGLKYEDFE